METHRSTVAMLSLLHYRKRRLAVGPKIAALVKLIKCFLFQWLPFVCFDPQANITFLVKYGGLSGQNCMDNVNQTITDKLNSNLA